MTPTASLTPAFTLDAPTATLEHTLTPAPSLTGLLPYFTETFDSGISQFWMLGEGWGAIGVDGGYALTASGTGDPAISSANSLTDTAVEARVRINAGSARLLLRVSANGSYQVTLDSLGTVNLVRNDVIVGTASLPTNEMWRTLRLTAVGGQAAVALDGTTIILYDDPESLPAGAVGFGVMPGGDAHFDSVTLYLPADSTIEPPSAPFAPEPTPGAPTAAQMARIQRFDAPAAAPIVYELPLITTAAALNAALDRANADYRNIYILRLANGTYIMPDRPGQHSHNFITGQVILVGNTAVHPFNAPAGAAVILRSDSLDDYDLFHIYNVDNDQSGSGTLTLYNIVVERGGGALRWGGGCIRQLDAAESVQFGGA